MTPERTPFEVAPALVAPPIPEHEPLVVPPEEDIIYVLEEDRTISVEE